MEVRFYWQEQEQEEEEKKKVYENMYDKLVCIAFRDDWCMFCLLWQRGSYFNFIAVPNFGGL